MGIPHLFSLLSLNLRGYAVKFQLTSIKKTDSVRQLATFNTWMLKGKSKRELTQPIKFKTDLD